MRCALRDGMAGRDIVAIAALSPLATRHSLLPVQRWQWAGPLRRPPNWPSSVPIGRAAIDLRSGAMCWSCQAGVDTLGRIVGSHALAFQSGLTRLLDKVTQTCACHDRHRMAMERCPASGHRCRCARLDSLQARNDTGGRSRLCARSQQRQLSAAMPPTCPTRHPCRQDRGARPACSRCRSHHPHRYPANAWRADPAHDPEWSAACRKAGRFRRST